MGISKLLRVPGALSSRDPGKLECARASEAQVLEDICNGLCITAISCGDSSISNPFNGPHSATISVKFSSITLNICTEGGLW